MNVLSLFKKMVTHRYLALVLRLYIAGIFIYASMYKINYTAEFAETIASYRLIPYWAVNIFAVALPWIELICGILLAAGVRIRSAAAAIGALLVMFSVGILINLLRDSPISCGCFHTVEDTISGWTLVRDGVWILMTLHIFFYDKAFHPGERFSLTIKEI